MSDEPIKVPAQEKPLSEMTPEDKKAMAHMLEWQGKRLIDCTKLELIDALIHMTAQVAFLQTRIAGMSIIQPGKGKIARLS